MSRRSRSHFETRVPSPHKTLSEHCLPQPIDDRRDAPRGESEEADQLCRC